MVVNCSPGGGCMKSGDNVDADADAAAGWRPGGRGEGGGPDGGGIEACG